MLALLAKYWRVGLFFLLCGVIGILLLTSGRYRGNAITYKDQRDKALSLAEQRQDTINDMKTRQRDVAALDAKYTKELADANAENAALQRKLDNGGRVLVKGRCPVPASTQATVTPGVGHDASVELSDVAGRNVLSIRSGIISDQKSLRFLQEYIRTQCVR